MQKHYWWGKMQFITSFKYRQEPSGEKQEVTLYYDAESGMILRKNGADGDVLPDVDARQIYDGLRYNAATSGTDKWRRHSREMLTFLGGVYGE